MDDKEKKATNKDLAGSKQETQNQVSKSFLTKVSEDLWAFGDFHISGQIRDRSNYGVLTEEGDVRAHDEEKKPHLEVSFEDIKTRTIVPGLEIEAVFKQSGEKVAGPFDLSLVFSPDEIVYMGQIDVEPGCYDVILRILNKEKAEKTEIRFEQLSYTS